MAGMDKSEGLKSIKNHQTSESFRLGFILAVSGGFMDAYSFLYRGKVFANAQTGNMLLLGINLSQRNFAGAFKYLCPVLAFTLGIILSDLIRHKEGMQKCLHWRQFAVLLEAVVLIAVAFIPVSFNLLANSLTSLACGIQVESFRKIQGNGIATTMCIGNLRSGTQNLCDYFFYKDKKYIKNVIIYYGIILFFVLGAIISSIVIRYLDGKSILVCSALLASAFIMMFTKSVKKESL